MRYMDGTRKYGARGYKTIKRKDVHLLTTKENQPLTLSQTAKSEEDCLQAT